MTKEKRQGPDDKRLPNHIRDAYDPKASEEDHSTTVRFLTSLLTHLGHWSVITT